MEPLSVDHKPNNDKELKRICEGGGYVEYNRVNGNLALSRALGDFFFKRNSNKNAEDQIVTGKLIVFFFIILLLDMRIYYGWVCILI